MLSRKVDSSIDASIGGGASSPSVLKFFVFRWLSVAREWGNVGVVFAFKDLVSFKAVNPKATAPAVLETWSFGGGTSE